MPDWYYELYVALVTLQKGVQASLSEQLRVAASEGASIPLLALALSLGTLHALTPGHGKSVVLTYFLGKEAAPREGFLMAARVAFAHTLTAVALVLVLGSAATVWGRPQGAATVLQTGSYAFIAGFGAYYLYRALRRIPDDHSHASARLLPIAVGVLPCPLTMVVVGHAMAIGAIGLGLLLAGTMGVGAALTIALFGLAGIASRRIVGGGLGQSTLVQPTLRVLEIGSSTIILLLGTLFLVGSL